MAWLNQNASLAKAATSAPIGDLLGPTENVGSLPVDDYVAKVAANAPPSREFFGPHHPLTTMSIEDWCEQAKPHQLGLVMHAAAQRLEVIAKEQENRMK